MNRGLRPDPLDADPELAGLVDDVLGDARTGGGDQTLRHGFEHLVIALEGSGLAVALPVGLEDHLGDAPLRANKRETTDWLKFTLEGAGERTHGYAFTDTTFAGCWI